MKIWYSHRFRVELSQGWTVHSLSFGNSLLHFGRHLEVLPYIQPSVHSIHWFLVWIFKMTQNRSIPFLPDSLPNIWSRLNIPVIFSCTLGHATISHIPYFENLSWSLFSSSVPCACKNGHWILERSTIIVHTHIALSGLSGLLCVVLFHPHSETGRPRPLLCTHFCLNRLKALGRQDLVLVFIEFQLHAQCFAYSSDFLNNCGVNEPPLLTLGLARGGGVSFRAWESGQFNTAL